MDIQAEKIELARRLLETDNEVILQKVKDIFEDIDWESLPNHVQAGIKRAKKQAHEGLLTPHNEVLKKYQKYL